jgi:hypothetical protein
MVVVVVLAGPSSSSLSSLRKSSRLHMSNAVREGVNRSTSEQEEDEAEGTETVTLFPFTVSAPVALL